MLLAYARISTTDEKQNIDNQIQLLLENGVEEQYIYQDNQTYANPSNNLAYPHNIMQGILVFTFTTNQPRYLVKDHI